MTVVPDEIRTKQLPDESLDRYLCPVTSASSSPSLGSGRVLTDLISKLLLLAPLQIKWQHICIVTCSGTGDTVRIVTSFYLRLH
jgi:hypothetical protein